MPATPYDAPYYANIITQCFPHIAVRDYQFITGGYDSIVLIVNHEYIFRFPRRKGVAAQQQRERRLLPAIAPTLPIAIPNFEFTWDEPEPYGLPFVGYRLIPGAPMLLEQLSEQHQERAAQQLAAFLTTLHRFRLAPVKEIYGEVHDAAAWRQSIRELYADVNEKVMPLLSPALQAKTRALWQFLDDDANWQFTACLTHADLGPDHILYDAPTEAITGIIDWGDAEVGDPAMDFAGFLGDYGPAFTDATLAAYGNEIDPALRQRAQFYADILCYRETLYGLYTNDPAHVQMGLAEIAETLGTSD